MTASLALAAYMKNVDSHRWGRMKDEGGRMKPKDEG